METDLALVLGLLIGLFSVPAALSALSDGRSPRIASIMVLLAGGLIVYALMQAPGRYSFDEIPDVVFRVIGQIVN